MEPHRGRQFPWRPAASLSQEWRSLVDATTCRLIAGIILMLVLLAGEIYLGHEVLSIISKLLD